MYIYKLTVYILKCKLGNKNSGLHFHILEELMMVLGRVKNKQEDLLWQAWRPDAINV